MTGGTPIDRIAILADAVANLEARARVHEIVLSHIVRWYFLQNSDPVNALRLISDAVLTTIDKARAAHVYTEKAAEEMRSALDRIVDDFQRNLEAKDF